MLHQAKHADDNGERVYLRPGDLSPDDAARILNRINSLKSIEHLQKMVENQGEEITLSVRDIKQIISSREKQGEFQALRQLAAVNRIGTKKFDMIVRVLST